jgi:2-oxoglutarate dehydrogenase E2 component (dihydrolipoamide succinyltransferase)
MGTLKLKQPNDKNQRGQVMSSGDLSEIKVPALGESIREATVARWLKSAGEEVKVDEALVELETDKVTLEVTSPASGILKEVRANTGSTVTVGDLLGLVEKGESASVAKPTSQTVSPSTPLSSSLSAGTASLSLPPSVRKLTEELKINPKDITPTGKGGRITKGDAISFAEGSAKEKSMDREEEVPEAPPILQAAAEPVLPIAALPSLPPISAAALLGGASPSPTVAAAPTMPRQSDLREERVKMTRLRQRIAERLKHAQNTAAILTTFNEVDMTAINALRSAYKESFEKKHGARLGIMSFFVKACVQALKEIPAVNAEIDGDEIIYKNYYDIGVAVSTPQGLVVPIVRDADRLSFAEVEKTIAVLGQKAKEGKLSIAEMTGGTFTISNGGVFGSLMATPILNPPQTGILGMHKIQDRPVAIDGKVEIRPMMYLALSYDHRVIDGRESVTFLLRVKENLEKPERLLLEM